MSVTQRAVNSPLGSFTMSVTNDAPQPINDNDLIKTTFIRIKPICITLMTSYTNIVKHQRQQQNHSGSVDNSAKADTDEKGDSDNDYIGTQEHIVLTSLQTLLYTIPLLSPLALCKSFDYIFFPLVQILSSYYTQPKQSSTHPPSAYTIPIISSHNNESILHYTLQCVTQLIHVCSSVTEQFTSTMINMKSTLSILNLLIQYVSPPPRKPQAESLSAHDTTIGNTSSSSSSSLDTSLSVYSEEIQLLSLKSIDTLLLALCDQINYISNTLTSISNNAAQTPHHEYHSFLLYVYINDTFLMCIGYLLSRLLLISQREKNRELRIHAIHMIDTILDIYTYQPIQNDDNNENDDRKKMHGIRYSGYKKLRGFLPGVYSGLYRIINGDFKAGSHVVSAAVHTYTHAIQYAMSDCILKQTLFKQHAKQKNNRTNQLHSELKNLQSFIAETQREVLRRSTACDESTMTSSTSTSDTSNASESDDEKWLHTAIQQLCKMFRLIFVPSIQSRHWRVEVALVESAHSIVGQCRLVLEKHRDAHDIKPLLLDFIITASQPDHPQVHDIARKALNTLISKGTEVYDKNMKEQLLQRLRQHIISFPRIVRTYTSDQQVSHINMLTGYIGLCQDHVVELLTSSFHPLFYCIAEAIKIDVHDIRVLESDTGSEIKLLNCEQHSSNDNNSMSSLNEGEQNAEYCYDDERNDASKLIEMTSQEGKRDEENDELVNSFFADNHDINALINKPDKQQDSAHKATSQSDAQNSAPPATYYATRFLYIRNESARRACLRMLQHIGRATSENIQPLIELLINVLIDEQQTTYRKEAILLLNQMIVGVNSTSGSHSLQSATIPLQLLLNEYIAPHLWQQLPSYAYNEDGNREMNNNIVTSSLLLRGIGDIASVLGGDGFAPYLMYVMYPLLDKLGDGSMIVSHAAAATLQRVAVAVNCKSAGDLVVENADYIVDNIAMQVRQYQRFISSSSNKGVAAGTSNKSQSSLQSSYVVTPSSTILHVLRAMLTKLPPNHIKSLLPYLQEVIDSVLDTLAEHIELIDDFDDTNVNTIGGEEEKVIAGGLTRLQYMQIVYLITHAIRSVGVGATTDTGTRESDQRQPTSKQPQTFYSDASIANLHAVNYYSPSNIRQRIKERIQSHRDQHDVNVNERKYLSDMIDASKANPNAGREWYNEVQAKKQVEEQKKYEGDDVLDNENDEADTTSSGADDEEEKLSSEEKSALQILQRCRHYLSSPSIHIQHVVLQTIMDGVAILSNRPKHLLPVLAKIWPSLKHRFKFIQPQYAYHASHLTTARGKLMKSSELLLASPSSDASPASTQLIPFAASLSNEFSNLAPTVVKRLKQPATASTSTPSISSLPTARYAPIFIQSMLLLASLAKHAAKFLASRFTQDVWPIINQTLTAEATSEELVKHETATHTNAYTPTATHDIYSPTVKVVGTTLRTLSELLHYPDLLYKHVADISKLCLPYLSNRMPPIITQLATELYCNMMQLDADAAYTALYTLCPSIVTNCVPQEMQHLDSKFRFVAEIGGNKLPSEHDLNTGIYQLLRGRNMYTNVLPMLQRCVKSSTSSNATLKFNESEYLDNVKFLLQKLSQQSEAHYSLF